MQKFELKKHEVYIYVKLKLLLQNRCNNTSHYLDYIDLIDATGLELEKVLQEMCN